MDGISFKKFTEGNSNSYTQFKTYLQGLNSINEMEYWFDREKLPANGLEEVKKKFQRLLYDSNANNSSGGLTPMGIEVFNAMGGQLRISLLGVANSNNIDSFKNLVSNYNSNFYSFINVK